MCKNHNRRDMLKLLGLTAGGMVAAGSPLRLLIDSLTAGLLGEAKAMAVGYDPRRWIDFRFDAAPPRWTYDLILNPTGSTAFLPNAQVGTQYTGTATRYTSVEYVTVRKYGINVPLVWNYNVPKASGGDRPMVGLLANFMNIRGVTTNNPGHPAARQLHYTPLGATQSLSALSGDYSSAPLAAVYAATRDFAFRSIANKSAVLLTGSDLISSLMAPFVSTAAASFKTQKAALRTHLDAVKSSIVDQVAAGHPGYVGVGEAMDGAHDLILRSFGDLTKKWDTLLAKYRTLMVRALDQDTVLAGINDLPIGVAAANRDLTYQVNTVLAVNPDLRSLIKANSKLRNMAEVFAVTEFIMTNNLSRSVTMNIESFGNLTVNGNLSVTQEFDEHFTGKMPSLFLNTFMARAHAACMLELIDQLKNPATPAGNIWSETIINCNGEFNRSPRDAGDGSDHGYTGASFALYSGAIQGPIIIGNVSADGTPGYPGTWGAGAGIDSLSGQQLDLGHVGASIATMLRVPSPLTARTTIVQEETAGQITPLIETGKIVA